MSVRQPRATAENITSRLTANAGLAAAMIAFLAAACCVLPFVFIALGLGGGWLAFLDNGLIYRQEVQILAVVIVLAGWAILLVRRPRMTRGTGRLLFATALIAMSALVWEFQGEIRHLLMAVRG